MATADVPPLVCTLTTGPLALQQLEWADLAEHATTRSAVEGGAESTYPLELADQIEDLAGREVACCGSWLQIAHERDDHAIRLRLTTANPDGVDLIRSLSGL
jgi:hypothetical protein